MQKIFVIIIFFVFMFSIHIYAQQDFRSIEGDMIWKVMKSNPNSKMGFRKNVMDIPDFPLSVKKFLANNWEGGDRKFRFFQEGDMIKGGAIYGGLYVNTVRIVRKGEITIGFDEAYAKYVHCFVLNNQIVAKLSDLKFEDGFENDYFNVRRYVVYFFGDDYGGKEQCNNFDWEIQDILVYPLIKENCQKLCKPTWKFSCWGSHSQDHFANPLADSVGYGSYYLTNIQSNKSLFIWTLLGNATLKLSLGSWSLVGSFEGGYNDGPRDYWLHLFGVEKNWGRKFYLQIGPELRYREWSYWKKTIINQTSPSTAEVEYSQHYIPIWETGWYGEINWFNNLGTNHFRATLSQCYRQPDQKVEIGTSEISSALKLELKRLYLFGSGMFKNMPKTQIDSFHVPLMDKRSGEGRAGLVINEDWTMFLRYRDILVRSFHDNYNPSWSKYIRKDYGLGVICKPKRFLGLQNVQIEFILSDSHIWQKFSNSSADTKERLVEFKATISYRWKK